MNNIIHIMNNGLITKHSHKACDLHIVTTGTRIASDVATGSQKVL